MAKIAIMVGTRPEIIKQSPIIKECERRGVDNFIIHTGQHYSHNMDRLFFEQLDIRRPEYNLEIKAGEGSHGAHTGRMMEEIEKVLHAERPSHVLVQGDTNTVLAGALATKKLSTLRMGKPLLGHVEAGLRSYDDSMPEEINRRLTDHVSDHLFAPTNNAARNALAEGIKPEKITVTGNTIVDALNSMHIESDIIEKLGLDNYFLVTMHRQENADSPERFRNVLAGLRRLHEKFGRQIIYPMHPRSKKIAERLGLIMPKGVNAIEPAGYVEFLALEKNAELVLTDSGGVQEEACILGVPCVTLRENTERPETLEIGANILAGTDPARIVEAASSMLATKRSWKNPFGDGKSSKRIVDTVLKNLA